MAPNFSGIAAAAELDFLLSHDDFEPAVEVDTVALDATIDSIAAAREILARLELLQAHLAAGGDADAARGLALDVHLSVDALGMISADCG